MQGAAEGCAPCCHRSNVAHTVLTVLPLAYIRMFLMSDDIILYYILHIIYYCKTYHLTL